ncbi:hypothetical protein FGIG_06572 [Fasciola gigantica]|uniref:Uncharacterized protein n=1 Tax=Fasciola gigantica TaxID=46835 RepID=A0A504X056_FASGI|nr:hypothetical protein FGIG_06572 [Fasciola gigantica]
MTVAPVRCLFKELEVNKVNLADKTYHGNKCKQEADRACERSVELFRLRYNFDVVQMHPVEPREHKYKENVSSTDSAPIARRCVSCGSFMADLWENLPADVWSWQSVCLETDYVPKFYHATRSYSDGCIRSATEEVTKRLDVPPTPIKPCPSRMNSGTLHPLADTHPSKTHSLPGKPVQVTIPLVVHKWGARIRRNSSATTGDKKREKFANCSISSKIHPLQSNSMSGTVLGITSNRSDTPKLLVKEQRPITNEILSNVRNLVTAGNLENTRKPFTQLHEADAVKVNNSQRPTTCLRQMKLSDFLLHTSSRTASRSVES